MNMQQRIHERINCLKARHPGAFDLSVTGYQVGPARRTDGLSLFVSTVSGVGFELPILPGDDVKALTAAFELVH